MHGDTSQASKGVIVVVLPYILPVVTACMIDAHKSIKIADHGYFDLYCM